MLHLSYLGARPFAYEEWSGNKHTHKLSVIIRILQYELPNKIINKNRRGSRGYKKIWRRGQQDWLCSVKKLVIHFMKGGLDCFLVLPVQFA